MYIYIYTYTHTYGKITWNSRSRMYLQGNMPGQLASLHIAARYQPWNMLVGFKPLVSDFAKDLSTLKKHNVMPSPQFTWTLPSGNCSNNNPALNKNVLAAIKGYHIQYRQEPTSNKKQCTK